MVFSGGRDKSSGFINDDRARAASANINTQYVNRASLPNLRPSGANHHICPNGDGKRPIEEHIPALPLQDVGRSEPKELGHAVGHKEERVLVETGVVRPQAFSVVLLFDVDNLLGSSDRFQGDVIVMAVFQNY